MTKSFEAKARIITGAASEEAKRWLDDKEFDSDAMFAVHEFARHLDQEAQEKGCGCVCHGSPTASIHGRVCPWCKPASSDEKPCDHIWGGYSYPKCVKCGIDVVVREPKAPFESASQLEKPQQPEEIEEVQWPAGLKPDNVYFIDTVAEKLNEVVRSLNALNRLTHKD